MTALASGLGFPGGVLPRHEFHAMSATFFRGLGAAKKLCVPGSAKLIKASTVNAVALAILDRAEGKDRSQGAFTIDALKQLTGLCAHSVIDAVKVLLDLGFMHCWKAPRAADGRRFRLLWERAKAKKGAPKAAETSASSARTGCTPLNREKEAFQASFLDLKEAGADAGRWPPAAGVVPGRGPEGTGANAGPAGAAEVPAAPAAPAGGPDWAEAAGDPGPGSPSAAPEGAEGSGPAADPDLPATLAEIRAKIAADRSAPRRPAAPPGQLAAGLADQLGTSAADRAGQARALEELRRPSTAAGSGPPVTRDEVSRRDQLARLDARKARDAPASGGPGSRAAPAGGGATAPPGPGAGAGPGWLARLAGKWARAAPS